MISFYSSIFFVLHHDYFICMLFDIWLSRTTQWLGFVYRNLHYISFEYIRDYLHTTFHNSSTITLAFHLSNTRILYYTHTNMLHRFNWSSLSFFHINPEPLQLSCAHMCLNRYIGVRGTLFHILFLLDMLYSGVHVLGNCPLHLIHLNILNTCTVFETCTSTYIMLWPLLFFVSSSICFTFTY